MKIVDLKVLRANRSVFCQIYTDEGIVGLGESGAWGFLEASAAALETMKEYLLGKDPLDIEHHWQYLYRFSHFRGAAVMGALSAIDIALWDIAGKYFHVPVYKLLGGKCRDKVRSYGAVFQFTPEDMAKGCLELKEQGFTAARLMITGDARQRTTGIQEDIYNRKVQSYVDKVAACREAVGDDFDFCLEVHRSMNPAEAVAFGRSVEQYRPLFLEDPIPPDQVDVMAQVASQVAVPIATGERAISIQEMEQIMGKKAARYVRPDVCALGGISPCKKVAAMAEANYVGIVPHNPLGPVSTAACLQLDACIPNFTIQEFPSFYLSGGESAMLKEPLQVENGYIRIPDGPGIGIELAEDITEKFPPKQRSINAQISYDGSVRDL